MTEIDHIYFVDTLMKLYRVTGNSKSDLDSAQEWIDRHKENGRKACCTHHFRETRWYLEVEEENLSISYNDGLRDIIMSQVEEGNVMRPLLHELLVAFGQLHERCFTCSSTRNPCQRLELIKRVKKVLNIDEVEEE